MQLARYDVRNDGGGPYAVFYCDQCGREFRTEPAVAASGFNILGRSALEGLLREIPVVGSAVANSIDDPRYTHTLSSGQVHTAWEQVQEVLHECPTCRRFVCPNDFDAPSGYCTQDRPPAAAEDQPDTPVADGTAAPALRVCPQCQAHVAAAHAFCTNCGSPMVPEPAVCPRCGSPVEGRFCGTCGAKVG